MNKHDPEVVYIPPTRTAKVLGIEVEVDGCCRGNRIEPEDRHMYDDETLAAHDAETDPSPWCPCGTCSPEDGRPTCVRND